MNFIKKSFENRTIWFYIGLGAAVIALVSGILFLILRAVDKHEAIFLVSNDGYLYATISFLIIGALSQGLVVFTDFKFAPMIPVMFYSLAFGAYMYSAMFQLANIFTGVSFFDGNEGFAIAFMIVLALCAVAGIIACFTDQRKNDLQVGANV